MKISFYGGVGEIGGNKILIQEGSTRLFLDFGKSYHEASKYFEEYLNPRSAHGIKDYLELDLIPRLEGLYRKDLIDILRKEEWKDLKYTAPFVDGVLLSHGHLDHCAYISFLDEKIPVFTSETTAKVLRSLTKIRPKVLENEILEVSVPHSKQATRRKRRKRVINTISNSQPFTIKNLTITPLFIDHSIPGAVMYFIKGKKINLLYSGDFRLSEIPPERLQRLYQFLAKKKIDVFLCEGTRVQEKKIVREKDVYRRAKSIIEKVSGLVVADYSLTDITRFRTLAAIARETGRTMVLPFNYFGYLAFLKEQGYPIDDFKNIRLYPKKKATLKRWEKELLTKYPVVDKKDLKEHQKNFLVVLNFYQIQELIDIQPQKGSYFLRAITEPHSEEMEISEGRFANWIEHFQMLGLVEQKSSKDKKNEKDKKDKRKFIRTHISGHISGKELELFINKIKPRLVIPIHTEHPKEFQKFCKNVLIVRRGESIEV